MAKETSLLADRIYDRIRNGLLAGEWSGGDTLSETELAREWKVSRTPVREALHKLENEGFICSLPKRKTIVRCPTRQDILDLLQLREALEIFAVSELAPVVTDAQLEEMSKILAQMTAARTSAKDGKDIPDPLAQAHTLLDAAFHMVILRSLGNQRILKVVEDCRMMTQLLGVPKTLSTERFSRWEQTATEHQAILDALRKKDPIAARDSMSRHLCIARERAMGFYARMEQQNMADSMPLPAWPAHIQKAIRDLEKSSLPEET